MIISFFNVLNNSLVRYWPLAVTCVAEGYTSVKRIEKFLLKTEIHQQYDYTNVGIIAVNNNLKETIVEDGDGVREDITDAVSIGNNTVTEDVIIMDNVTAKWDNGSGLINVNIRFEAGELYGIVGSVGSGKTTLFQVLLGELAVMDGGVTINGSISYTSQEPWLFEATVRENIIFTETFDEIR